MNDIELTEFIPPHSLEALEGVNGFTNYDMALGLGVPVYKVNQKLGNGKFVEGCKAAGMRIIPFGINHRGGAGRPGKLWAFDINAAKSFVARWDNAKGWEYMKYLLACEAVKEKIVPQLRSHILELEDKVDRLERKKHRKHKIIQKKQTLDIFGDLVDAAVAKMIRYNEMDPEEKRQYQMQHMSRVSKGLALRLNDELELKGKKMPRLLAVAKTPEVPSKR